VLVGTIELGTPGGIVKTDFEMVKDFGSWTVGIAMIELGSCLDVNGTLT